MSRAIYRPQTMTVQERENALFNLLRKWQIEDREAERGYYAPEKVAQRAAAAKGKEAAA